MHETSEVNFLDKNVPKLLKYRIRKISQMFCSQHFQMNEMSGEQNTPLDSKLVFFVGY